MNRLAVTRILAKRGMFETPEMKEQQHVEHQWDTGERLLLFHLNSAVDISAHCRLSHKQMLRFGSIIFKHGTCFHLFCKLNARFHFSSS